MVFENGVKNIQAAAYNGARTVNETCYAFAFLFSIQSASKSFSGTESLFCCKYDLIGKGKNNFINVHSKRFKSFLW
jgi:hypothetical protein